MTTTIFDLTVPTAFDEVEYDEPQQYGQEWISTAHTRSGQTVYLKLPLAKAVLPWNPREDDVFESDWILCQRDTLGMVERQLTLLEQLAITSIVDHRLVWFAEDMADEITEDKVLQEFFVRSIRRDETRKPHMTIHIPLSGMQSWDPQEVFVYNEQGEGISPKVFWQGGEEPVYGQMLIRFVGVGISDQTAETSFSMKFELVQLMVVKVNHQQPLLLPVYPQPPATTTLAEEEVVEEEEAEEEEIDRDSVSHGSVAEEEEEPLDYREATLEEPDELDELDAAAAAASVSSSDTEDSEPGPDLGSDAESDLPYEDPWMIETIDEEEEEPPSADDALPPADDELPPVDDELPPAEDVLPPADDVLPWVDDPLADLAVDTSQDYRWAMHSAQQRAAIVLAYAEQRRLVKNPIAI